MFCLSLFLFFLPVHANNARKPRLWDSRQMSITYGSPSWNTDSSKIDSAYLILRDRASGRLVQIQLEETEPDSSEFTGRFSMNLAEAGKVSPEIFIPPQDLRTNDKGNRKLFTEIQAGRVPNKPVIFRRLSKDQTRLEVYDTREQAMAALRAHKERERLGRKVKQNARVTPQGNKAELNLALDQMALEAATRGADRVRLEQIERQKAAERERQLRGASRKQQVDRKAKAEVLNREAMVFFDQGEFLKAEEKFKESVELDPENKTYYFKYGVSLYRNAKFDEALVILKIAEVDAMIENERQYYIGLIHYRLKELDGAVSAFETVAKSNHPLAPSANFYLGIVLFTQEFYEKAKACFERVIDTSTDPRMDEQAEQYLERIANSMVNKKRQEQKFTVVGVVGLMYDSNVLLAPDSASDQGSATDIADVRLVTIADVEYRPLLNDRRELSARLNANLTNSAKDTAAVADPFQYQASFPYTLKGQLWGKSMRLSVKPGAEYLFMAATDPEKKNIFRSYFLGTDLTLVMRDNWFSTYGFEARLDDSLLPDAEGPSDGDGIKYTLKTDQTWVLNKARRNIINGSLAIIYNAAKGENEQYNRIDMGVTFSRSVFWKMDWISGLQTYLLSYPNAEIKRDDFNTTFLTGLNKPMRDWVIWGLSGSYTKNSSNISSNSYSKYMVLTTATFITNF